MVERSEDFITVEEAARRLRIGRTRAYVEARLYVDTDGAEGVIPAIAVGRIYRVPVARLEEIAGGPLRAFHRAAPPQEPQPDPQLDAGSHPVDRPGRRARRPRAALTNTPSLFDS